jgi:hypothetical protein
MNKLKMTYQAENINDLCIKFINTFKGYVSFSPKETAVLAFLLEKHLLGITEFDTNIRNEAQEKLELSNYSLNNYIKALKDQSLLEYSPSGNLKLASLFGRLKPMNNDNKITITFEFDMK